MVGKPFPGELVFNPPTGEFFRVRSFVQDRYTFFDDIDQHVTNCVSVLVKFIFTQRTHHRLRVRADGGESHCQSTPVGAAHFNGFSDHKNTIIGQSLDQAGILIEFFLKVSRPFLNVGPLVKQ